MDLRTVSVALIWSTGPLYRLDAESSVPAPASGGAEPALQGPAGLPRPAQPGTARTGAEPATSGP